MEVLALRDLCLYSVVFRPKAFPPAALSLLPLRIRRELLRLLAAVDIWPLEGCPDFTRDLDMEELWRERLESHILSWAVNVEYKEQATARESYLRHISRVLILSCPRGFSRLPLRTKSRLPTTTINKKRYLSFLLHGVVGDNSPPPFRYVSYEFDAICLTPPQYKDIEASRTWGHILNVASYFMQQSGWHPRTLEVGITEHVDDLFASYGSIHCGSFLDFFSQLEDISLAAGGDEYVRDGARAQTLLQGAAANSQHLKSVSIETIHHILDGLIATLIQSYGGEPQSYRIPLFGFGPCRPGGYSKLKKVEITRVIVSRFPEAWKPEEDWGIFLRLQDELEELRLSGFRNNMSESLSNFLPHLIATRPSLRFLHLDQSQINRNAFEAIMKTFLCTPTTHEQTLDLGTCWAGRESQKMFSFMEGSSLYPHISSTCQNGELKTLCVPFTASGVCSLPWILDQPNLRLKRLDLTLCSTEEKLMKLHGTLVSRGSPLPVRIITVHLFRDPVKLWGPGKSRAVKLLISCPEVRAITAVNFGTKEEILVVYNRL